MVAATEWCRSVSSQQQKLAGPRRKKEAYSKRKQPTYSARGGGCSTIATETVTRRSVGTCASADDASGAQMRKTESFKK